MKLFKAGASNRGISLVETMIAILLFGAVIGALLEVTAQNLTMGKRAETVYTAYGIAKNRIETLKTAPFSNLPNATESNTRVDSLGVPDLSGAFSRTTTVSTNYTGDANLISVTVSVDYQIKGSFVNKPTTVSTAIFQYA